MYRMGLALIVVFISTSVMAQGIFQSNRIALCADTKTIVEELKKVGEDQFEFIGFIEPEKLLEKNMQVVVGVFRNLKTGSFSIVETSTSGVSCVTSVGMGDVGSKKKNEEKKL